MPRLTTDTPIAIAETFGHTLNLHFRRPDNSTCEITLTRRAALAVHDHLARNLQLACSPYQLAILAAMAEQPEAFQAHHAPPLSSDLSAADYPPD